MEIAVVGDDDFVTGFMLAGITHIHAPKEYDRQVQEIVEDRTIGILVMEESDFDKLKESTKRMLEKVVTPVIITLSKEGKEENLRDLIKKSVGVDLWKGK